MGKAARLLFLALAVSVITATPSSFAADDFLDLSLEDLVLEEVVVSSRKREENLQRVPIAVTVFTQQDITRGGIERPQDFIDLTPNVTMVDTVNIGDTQVTIRGIVSTRDAESSFAYVVDGVLVTNPNGFNQELFDVQQIEVLKGPQGALYGRNATAGAILITTNKPSQNFEGQIKAGVGTDNLSKASAVVSGPLTDKIAGRLAFSYRDDEGQYKNEISGGDTVDFIEDMSIRGRLIWDVSENLKLDFQLSHSDVEAGAINFNAVFALSDIGGDFYKDVNSHKFVYAFNVPGENEQERSAFSLKAEYGMDWADLTAILAYDDLEESLLSDGTSAAFGIYAAICDPTTPEFNYAAPYSTGMLPPYSPTTCDGYQYQERNQDSVSLELRLAGEAESINWTAGMYYADISRQVVVAYGADFGRGYIKQPYVPSTGDPATEINPTDLLFDDDFDTEVASLFGQFEYEFTDAIEIALAFRWDREERTVSNNVPFASSPYNGNTNYINPGFSASVTSLPDRNKTFSQFQPKITGRWQTSDAVSLYASYGVGFRSGGFNGSGSADLIDQAYGGLTNSSGVITAPQNLHDSYDKEVSNAFELGAKTEWFDRRLRVNAAVFHTEIDDNQFFNFFAGDFGLQRTITNIDEVTLQGLEIDFVALHSQHWKTYGSYGFVSSEINENKNRPFTEGNDAPLVPESTANLGVQYSHNINNTLEFFMRLDWNYTGKTWFSTVQDDETGNAFTGAFGYSTYDQARRDAYDTINLRLSLESESWSATAWGNNITDESYLEEVIPAPEFGGSFIHQSRGEAYGLDLTYRF
jgi:iron complex outermembrane receptor protein